jgi:hypothetical protein
MPEKSITPQVKKLHTLRRILWISYVVIAVPSIIFLMGIFSMRDLGTFGSKFSGIALLIGPFLLIAGLGVVCIVIYYIFKYRLEKDDELFL